MDLHRSITLLAKRLNLFAAAPLLVSACAYLITLSDHVHPGKSAFLIATTVGLDVQPSTDSPLLTWLARQIADLHVLTLPLRLNAFSAALGILGATLFYLFVSHLVFFLACESRGGAGRVTGSDIAPEPEAPPEVASMNLKILHWSILAGLVASFLLTFGTAFWMSSTHFDTGTWHLFLMLLSAHLLLLGKATQRGPVCILLVTLSFFVYMLGLFEHVAFVVALPCYAYFLFMSFFVSSRRKQLVSALFVAGMLALALSFFAFSSVRPLGPNDLLPRMLTFLGASAAHHYHQLSGLVPATGWILVVAQTALPAAFLLFGSRALFCEHKYSTALTLLLMTVTSAPSFLITPHSLMSYVSRDQDLPVFGYAILASAIAFAVAACLKIICLPPDATSSEDNAEPSRERTVCVFCATLFLVANILVTAIAPFRSLRHVDADNTRFADIIAGEILGQLKGRTWLISGGMLDNHLKIKARMLGIPLTVVPLSARTDSASLRRLEARIAADPVFKGLNRVRIQNALGIGTHRFINEWFTQDPLAGSHALVMASPEIWTASRFLPVPEGLAFGGTRDQTSISADVIDRQNRLFCEKVSPLLSVREPPTGADQTEQLRRLLQVALSFMSNELGVFLEEHNRPEAALDAYLRADSLCNSNISADINAYVLMRAKGLRPELVERLKKKIKGYEKHPAIGKMTPTQILTVYGSIRQSDFYSLQGQLWSGIGATATAVDKISKGAELATHTATPVPEKQARQLLQAGDHKQAQQLFQQALAANPSNHVALTGLATLALSNKDIDGAKNWLRQAARCSAPDPDLLHLTISLAILEKQDKQALDLLALATKKYPTDLRYWMLLADVLLRQKDSQKVEYEILPVMQKALGSQDHVLVHAMRGFILKNKGERYYKEARQAFLRALATNAGMADVWTALFEIDLALGNPEFIESDAKNQLAVTPGHALANYLLGTAYLDKGVLDRSEDLLRRSIETHTTAPACNNLGENLCQQKRYTEAEAFARQALSIQPDLHPAQDTLARALAGQGKFDEAAHYIKTALALSPNTPAYLLTELRIAIGKNDTAHVLRVKNQLLSLGTKIPQALQEEITKANADPMTPPAKPL